jgi:hypothetical protein
MNLFEAGLSVETVTQEIMKHLRIINISSEEVQHLDSKLEQKTTMPDGWIFGRGGARYSEEILKYRQCRRVAVVLRGHWEEGTGIHSRIFVLVNERFIIDGESVNGNGHKEHVVPLCLIRDECLKLYDERHSVETVTQAIMKHLSIVLISPKEQEHIDFTLKLKNKMPKGWIFGKDEILARLIEGGIKLK